MNEISSTFILSIVIIALWSFFWKGLALWRAARNNNGGWFVAILLINSLGILEIIYLFAIAKVKTNKLFKK